MNWNHAARRAGAAAVCLILVCFLPATVGAGEAYSGVSETDDREVLTYAPGQVIARFEPGTDADLIRSAFDEAGVSTIIRAIGPKDRKDTLLLELEPGRDVRQAAASLSAHPSVAYAEPNYSRAAMYTPDDPGFAYQWALENSGQYGGTPGADIGAENAWDIERGYTTPVVAAVLDSGIRLGHPDLAGKLWVNSGEVPGDGIDNDKNGYVDDVHGYNFAGISQTSYYYLSESGNPVLTARKFGDTAATSMFAQSITGTGCDLTHATLMLKRNGSPASGITVSVRTSLSGQKLRSFTINPSQVTPFWLPGPVPMAFNAPLKLTSDKTYYLVFETSSPSSNNYYSIYHNDGSKGEVLYSGGHEYYFNGSSWKSYSEDDFYFKTNPNSNPADDNGHGTYVSGILGAADNGIGIVGVSPGVTIMPLKVMDSSGVPSAAINASRSVEAIYYAADNGAKVISMSLGSFFSSTAEQEAIDYAYKKGVLLAAAAGNFGNTTMLYPAGCNHVMGVGATTYRDQWGTFSNHNSSVDVTAPGQDVFSTSLDGEYMLSGGTSAATPHVAGLASLVFSMKPSYSPAKVEQIIKSTSKDLGAPGRDDYYGYGRIDAFKALSSIPGQEAGPTWYLAEGSTGWGFSTYITIANPNTIAVTCKVTYMPTGSENVAQELYLPPRSQITVNPADSLGEKDFSTRVECNEGKTVAVDRTMTWNGPGAASPEGHSSVGVTSSARTWYLPEGSTNWGFETWLLIQNPNSSKAACTVTYMIEGEEPRVFTKEVGPRSRQTYNVAEDIGAKDASIKVEADVPVIPERAMYRNNRREGHGSIGTKAPAIAYYLAEGSTAWGFTTYVLVQNPSSEPNEVTMTYMTTEGPVQQAPITMDPNSRKTIRVNDVLPGRDFSTRVTGTGPLIAERAMYWDAGLGEACHDSIGTTAPATRYYLPDGQSSDGRETWTLVQNPNDSEVEVEFTYMTPDGKGNVTRTEKVAANSRRTFNMAEHSGINGRAAVMVISTTTGKKIMVERAMYWNGRGAGTDTIGGSGS